MSDLFSFKLDKKNAAIAVMTIMSFALVIRVLIGMSFFHTFDTYWYLDWAKQLPDNFFTAYVNIDSLDYPPGYLFPLYLVGLVYNNIPLFSTYPPLIMLILKIVPILVDVLVIYFIYRLFKGQSELIALFLAGTYALNPSAIYNCANWGQTDSIIILALLLMFYYFEKQRPVAATIVFTIASLTKFQCLLFAPIILIILIKDYNIKKLIKCIGIGAGIVAVVFLPFIIASDMDFMLPIKVYTGGFGAYPFITLNAANIYGIFALNWVPDTTGLLFGISLSNISSVLLILIVFAVMYIYVIAKKPCVWLTSFLLLQSIFMLTTRMHDRYQIPVLILCMAAAIRHRSKELFGCYIGLTAVTFLNQCLLLSKMVPQDRITDAVFVPLMQITSGVNVVIYVYSGYLALKIMGVFDKKTKDEDKNAADSEQSEVINA